MRDRPELRSAIGAERDRRRVKTVCVMSPVTQDAPRLPPALDTAVRAQLAGLAATGAAVLRPLRPGSASYVYRSRSTVPLGRSARSYRFSLFDTYVASSVPAIV